MKKMTFLPWCWRRGLRCLRRLEIFLEDIGTDDDDDDDDDEGDGEIDRDFETVLDDVEVFMDFIVGIRDYKMIFSGLKHFTLTKNKSNNKKKHGNSDGNTKREKALWIIDKEN